MLNLMSGARLGTVGKSVVAKVKTPTSYCIVLSDGVETPSRDKNQQ